jgi:uncharacterized protein (TIGR03118 family)
MSRRAAAASIALVAVVLAAAGSSKPERGFVVRPLVADLGRRGVAVDRSLVNAWGLAASSTGPWWTANEARDSSTLYSGDGRKQRLTVDVEGGPTGVVFNGGREFRIAAAGRSDPARFIYACEDGKVRAWTPTVPVGWSTKSAVAIDEGAEAAVFRGIALAGGRLYVTDFHNARVDVYDGVWHRLRRRGAFADPKVPAWYAPFGIRAIGNRIFVTYTGRAPVNGNDSPTGGYVDEFDLDGRLVSRVAGLGALNAPWGLARAPRSFGRLGGDLLVGNFGDGRINAYRVVDGGWRHDGSLVDRHGAQLAINGLWAIAFGNGAMAGPRDTLFFTSGPHVWRGETEQSVHGLLGSIESA